MTFDPILAERRFGYGLSPQVAPPEDAGAMLAWVGAPDAMAARFAIAGFDAALARMSAYRAAVLAEKAMRAEGTVPQGAENPVVAYRRQSREDARVWMVAAMARRIWTGFGFQERLEAFWADHFTATGKAGKIRWTDSPYLESGIRPYIGGTFADMLVAVETHPLMLHYLDQASSAGPNSRAVRRQPDKLGMNENLAREILELHTLGVGGPYTQADVTQLAELLTGLGWDESGTVFRAARAEPGAEVVLGRSYGGGRAGMADIEAALRDIAGHEAVAGHLARKLAVHFVADDPPEGLVAHVAGVWRETGGHLPSVYAAMLGHPEAWSRDYRNVLPPFAFICASLRALAVSREALDGLAAGQFRQRIYDPLARMGHRWQEPSGPDGLPEADSAWISPQGIATRLHWAATVPQQLVPELPDPRVFVETALGPRVPEVVRFAAEAAESRAEGIGLVLASPAFQRV
jgi:uncharacterized protein (DUF1800 family)